MNALPTTAILFGNIIQARRKALGLSLYRVEQVSGIAESTLRAVEAGRHDVRLRTFIEVCHALKLNPTTVMRQLSAPRAE